MGTRVTQMFDGRTGIADGPAGGPAAVLSREGLLGDTGLTPRIQFGAVPGQNALPIVILPLVSTNNQVVEAICQAVYTMVEATKSFQIVILTDMPVFKDVRPFHWPIEHICTSGNAAGASGSSEALILAIRRTIALYGASFVLECDELGVVAESWRSLLESLGIESEGLLHLAKVKRPHVGPSVKLRSWAGWRSRVNGEVQSLTVGTRVDHAMKLSLNLADNSSFGALVISAGDVQGVREGLLERNWNAAFCDSPPRKSEPERMRDYEAALDGLALAGLGFVCVVGNKDDGTFCLDFHLWTQSGLRGTPRVEADTKLAVREEILRMQKKLERAALAGLATSTLASVQ